MAATVRFCGHLIGPNGLHWFWLDGGAAVFYLVRLVARRAGDSPRPVRIIPAAILDPSVSEDLSSGMGRACCFGVAGGVDPRAHYSSQL